ncbi:DUF4145 domain-containing protein [Rhizobium rhizogenes]|uniref:DUF4145 domain-containing protein n=2 Tax=Rhizobium/Agrobacterium group TaxID=227290 RepID=A0AA95AHS2_RHIRH|nr:DUF4145 domain-containing protein [Rhizobium rhizogenes]QDG94035.1 DUF4145 domain-containing protein [Rhizobium sp. NIBRBAC000502774]TRA88262.1 DUF4145 domain-containing protein [Rhizobium rhizogenes]
MKKENQTQPEAVLAHCPTCNDKRNCDLHAEVDKPWNYSDRQGNSMWGASRYRFLECRGCETVFYQHSSWNSESLDPYYTRGGEELFDHDVDLTTYPSPNVQIRPIWEDIIQAIDPQLKTILHQMYVAIENQAYILAAVGMRTVLDRATEILNIIDPNESFEKKLTALKSSGLVGQTEYEILDVIVDAGNAAAHRGWSPSKDDTQKMTNALEAFLHRAFIVGKDALTIKSKIPPRPKRKPPREPDSEPVPPRT